MTGPGSRATGRPSAGERDRHELPGIQPGDPAAADRSTAGGASPDPHPDDKPGLRRRYRRLRRQALTAAAAGLRAAACSSVPSLLRPGRYLGLYWPVGSEPDLDPLAPGGLAERLGWQRLALPAVLPPTADDACGRLVYLPWDPGMALRPDACGIPSPLPAPEEGPADPGNGPERQAAPAPAGLPVTPLPPEALGLLLVPALALDRRGIRLGSGGGWYDRLRAESRWRRVPALAVLPSVCHCRQLPADPWDVPFDGWLDERGSGRLPAP